MGYKIYLSPEDRATNTYNINAKYNGKPTNEKEQMCRCADYMEIALKRCGFEVKNSQTGNMYTRVSESNKWKSDMHIALHTNGFDGKVAGTRVHCYPSDRSRKIGKLIQDRIAPASVGKSDILKESSSLYELKAPNSVSVLPEFGFHDNAEEAQWLIDNMQWIAEETTHAVCDYFGVKYIDNKGTNKSENPTTSYGECTVILPILKVGCVSQTVKMLQILLVGLGYGVGTAGCDGDFGNNTKNAVMQYQSTHKECGNADGVVGLKTWESLLGVEL